MPKQAKLLSTVEVKRKAKRQGFHAAGGVAGLHLNVTDTLATSWILRTTVGKRRRDVGLGPYPEVTLARAREIAAETKKDIRKGIDPVAGKIAARDALRAEQAKTRTFKHCAEAFLARKTPEFRNAKHAAQWKSTLEAYAYPVIGNLPVDAVELGHIVRILEPLWVIKTETATRLRGRLESVLAYATVSDYRKGDNPATWRGNLDAILPRPAKLKNVKHHAALPVDLMPAFWERLQAQEGTGALALQFAILTAGRSGEVRGARWDEIDLTAKIWTIPGDRMKAGRERVVPLCPAALTLLKELPRDNNLIFPAPRGGQLSDMTLGAVLKRMDVNATTHGFRSTFRTWTAERTAYPPEVCEQALAHSLGALERAYRRTDLLEKRRRLMRDWQNFLKRSNDVGAVRPIRASA